MRRRLAISAGELRGLRSVRVTVKAPTLFFADVSGIGLPCSFSSSCASAEGESAMATTTMPSSIAAECIGSPPRCNDRQHDARRVLGVAIDSVGLLDHRAIFFARLSGSGVHVKARLVAGSDRHADAVALVED